MNIKILQQNMKCNNRKDKLNTEKLVQTWFAQKPDVIMLSEFCYARHKRDIIEHLSKDYNIFVPCDFTEADKENERMTAACCMAVNKEITFTQSKREYIQSTGRYITGTLKTNKKNIEIYFSYVAQGSAEYKYVAQERAEYKAEMLFDIYRFWTENKGKDVFIGGDFNTDIKNIKTNTKEMDENKTIMKNLFKPLYMEMKDTDSHEPTWENKCLDYALVSESLYNYSRTTRLTNIEFDHIGLVTEIQVN